MAHSVSDLALLQRWRTQNDATAFNALASRYTGMVYATCLRVLGNTADAEDVAQECFEVLALVPEGPREHLAGWLHTVATNRSLNRIRDEKRRKRREAEFASLYETHGQIEWDDLYEHIDQAVEDLPERLRVPVVAHFLQGESHAAISEKLGLSRRGVTHRIEKGLARIRKTFRRRGILVGTGALAAAMKGSSAAAAPSTLVTAVGKLAIAAGMPARASGVVSGSAAATSEMAVYGGVLVMTKKLLVALGVFALVLGVSYLFLAPNRGSISEIETINTATTGEQGPSPLRAEPEEKAPRASDRNKPGSIEDRRGAAENRKKPSGASLPDLEDLMHALRQPRGQDEDDLVPIRSSDIPPDNGAHYFLLAAERFPDVDRDWLKAKLEELRTTGVMEDPDLLAFLTACQESFEAVRQGVAVGNAMLPPGRWPDELLPYLSPYRNLAYAMCLEAEMLAARGAYGDALAMYETLMGFGPESGQGGMIINGLVGNHIEAITMESLRYAIESGWATPDEYRFLIDQLYAADARQYRMWETTLEEARGVALWVDRLIQEGDTVLAEACEQVFGDVEGLREALSGMTPAEIESLCRQMVTDYERVAAYLELPYYEAQQIDADSLLGDNPISQTVIERIPRLNIAEAQIAAKVRGTLVMAAVELYRTEHGTYPPTLTQLEPNYLPVLPQDPYTGGNLGYAVQGNDYLLYSFAQDMKDDGGIALDETGPFWTWQGDCVIHGQNVSIR